MIQGSILSQSLRQVGISLIPFAIVLSGFSIESFAQTNLQSLAQGENEYSMATNIFSAPIGLPGGGICPRLNTLATPTPDQTDLTQRCNAMVGLSNGTAQDQDAAKVALGQVTGEEISAQQDVINGTVQRQTRAVAARISALGRRIGSPSLADASHENTEERVLLASANWQVATDSSTLTADKFSGLGMWLTSSYNFGDRDETDLEHGFDFDEIAVTGGVDYRFLDNLTGGLALGYSYTDIDFDHNGGDLKADAYTVALYSLWQPLDQLGLSGYASYGRVDYDSRRKIDYLEDPTDPTSAIRRTAKGNTDANQFELTGNANYDFNSGPWTYGPTGWISYLKLYIDDFQESGAQGLNLEYDDQNPDSLQTALGGQVNYALSTSYGVAVIFAHAHWLHEFLDDAESTDAKYVANPFADSPTITVTTDDPDRDWALFGVGASFVFPGGISAFGDFETVQFKDDVTSYTLTAGLRMEF